jgi:hypothetical protein
LHLGSQLRNLLACAESCNHGTDARCQQEQRYNAAGQGDGIMDTVYSSLQWLLLGSPIRLGRDAA